MGPKTPWAENIDGEVPLISNQSYLPRAYDNSNKNIAVFLSKTQYNFSPSVKIGSICFLECFSNSSVGSVSRSYGPL